ncbi:unnamed protein product [Ostreobium quekettii]|uniref:Uncharacterized protein n=1 Tax=Ostreobium quekettii TaxID=121088 RepID=A0A8S1JD49_9CHLO|nr:unnamed protein product [Ostreobium quekettii]
MHAHTEMPDLEELDQSAVVVHTNQIPRTFPAGYLFSSYASVSPYAQGASSTRWLTHNRQSAVRKFSERRTWGAAGVLQCAHQHAAKRLAPTMPGWETAVGQALHNKRAAFERQKGAKSKVS